MTYIPGPPVSVDDEKVDDALTIVWREFLAISAAIREGSWVDGVYENSWADFGGNYSGAQYRRDPFGFVHLRGLVDSGTVNTAIFTLPAGYRPGTQEMFTTYQSDGATDLALRIDVFTSGVVRQVNSPGGYNTFVSLSGITFKAEQ